MNDDAQHIDPSGAPCLFVPGYASSRWMAGWALQNGRLRRQGIRLVALDRPGYGSSSPDPAGGFVGWAADAATLAHTEAILEELVRDHP